MTCFGSWAARGISFIAVIHSSVRICLSASANGKNVLKEYADIRCERFSEVWITYLPMAYE
jgi:hypothetical protein